MFNLYDSILFIFYLYNMYVCAHAPICFKSHIGLKPTCFNDATSGGCHWKLLIFYNVYFLYFPIFPQWTCICIVLRKTCVITNYFSENLLWEIHLWHKVKRVCITFLANKEASEAGLLTGSWAIIVLSGEIQLKCHKHELGYTGHTGSGRQWQLLPK